MVFYIKKAIICVKISSEHHPTYNNFKSLDSISPEDVKDFIIIFFLPHFKALQSFQSLTVL